MTFVGIILCNDVVVAEWHDNMIDSRRPGVRNAIETLWCRHVPHVNESDVVE